MTTPVKTTLFNLKTSRAPELLSDDARQKYFIDHPDGSTGVFYTAVAGRPGGNLFVQPWKAPRRLLQNLTRMVLLQSIVACTSLP